MRSITTLLLAFILILEAGAQDDMRLTKSELRQLKREQRKAEQEALDEQRAIMTKAMIEQQSFVLEAEYLSNKYGSRVSVQSTINFIMVDSTRGTVQFGSAWSAGYNGVGGATLEGHLSNYRYNMVGKKKDAYSIMMQFSSSVGTYDITLMVNSTGRADATVKGNWSGSLSYHGKLVPIQASRTYKGHPIY